MAKDRWRRPGQNYSIEVAGLTVYCKPMTRGQMVELAESSQQLNDAGSSLEQFFKQLQDYVVEVEGIEGTIAEILDHQPHDVMLELFNAILGSANLSSTESKNSSSLSDTSMAEPSRE